MNNPENLVQQEAVKKLQELTEEINTCLFCTNLKTDDGATCRPMGTQKVDDKGDIWFFLKGSESVAPFSKEIMQQIYEGGQLSDETLVWREGMQGWKPVISMPELEISKK